MELTIIPTVIVMITLASQNWSPGAWEMIIILIIALILLGASRLPDMARGMSESIRNFKTGAPPERRQQSGDSRLSVFIVLLLFEAVIILSVLSLDVFSGGQILALTVTLLGWIGVGYWSFERNLRKRDGQ